jgi:hypothetical protein
VRCGRVLSGTSKCTLGVCAQDVGLGCAGLCCAVLCCALLCCAVLCCAGLCWAGLCCAVLCWAMLCCAVLFVCFAARCSLRERTRKQCYRSVSFCYVLQWRFVRNYKFLSLWRSMSFKIVQQSPDYPTWPAPICYRINEHFGYCRNSSKNWPQKVSDSILPFFCCLYETVGVVAGRFLKVRVLWPFR